MTIQVSLSLCREDQGACVFPMVTLRGDRVSLARIFEEDVEDKYPEEPLRPPVDFVWMRSKPLLCCGTEIWGAACY